MIDVRRFPLARHDDDSSALIYMLAGVGLGAIIGAAAGLLFAPKAGTELREDLTDRYKELKGRAEGWVGEQRGRLTSDAGEELGV
ncbi:MAG: YtxH domain-containing protein [Fimbriimonas sp.]